MTTSDVGAARYGWDKLGRMLYAATPSGGSSDYYRADGQRIEKVANASLSWTQWTRTSGQYDLNLATSGASTRYFYDGQMGMEDDYNPSGSVTVVNRYGLGARGIDRIERTENSSTTYGYPLYDGHGNMRTTLGRNGTGYTTGTLKTYDVWGSVRSGGDSSDPTQKYCANLGHVSDDDSGLIYMRARYHEPSTGRFISQDWSKQGWNWFVYCGDNGVTRADPSGQTFYDHLSLQEQWSLALRFSNEFRGEAGAALAFWTALMAGEFIVGNPLGIPDRMQKMVLLSTLAADYLNEVLGGTAVADIGTRVEAYYMGHQCMLRITMIFLDLT